MPVIWIEKDYISLNDIQQCVDIFREIITGKQIEKKIHLIAKTQIKGFDLQIVGYFILFINQVKDIELVIELPYNLADSGDEQIEFQLKQAGTYAFIITGKSVFTLILGELGNKKSASFDLSKSSTFPDQWYVYSKDFFPVLFINDNEKQFDLLFRKGLNELSKVKLDQLDKALTWINNSVALKSSYHNFIRETSTPSNRRNALINLARMAFFNALDEAKIAHLFFESYYSANQFDRSNRTQAGNLVNKKAMEYYQSIKPLFIELSKKSIIHQFLYSTILSTELLNDHETGKDILNEDTKEEFVNKLYELWNFTKDLVASLMELAKNIKEHAKPAVGAITLRVFGNNKWGDLKLYGGGDQSVYSNYIDRLNADKKRPLALIDINIFDLGQNGVIPTLMESTEKLINDYNSDTLNELINEDLFLLANKKIKFQNLLDTSNQRLNQQSKRSIAHFGLLTFSKLIEVNDGLIVASTHDVENKRELAIGPKTLAGASKPISYGTNYHVVLPIKKSDVYKTHLPHALDLPSDISAKELRGMEELLKYEIIKIDFENINYPIDGNDKYIICLDLPQQALNTREDENALWHTVKKSMALLIEVIQSTQVLFSLNLERITINESQLFRLLGNWELNYPSYPLAVTNVQNDTYQKLLIVNGDFHKLNERLDYWNSNIASIIYSYIPLDSGRFYFADILWGRQRSDFININWIINHTNFNSTVLLNRERMKNEVVKNHGEINTNTGILFYNKNTLLPFDLIFEGQGITTLFEHNALVLLKNEIKS